MLLTGPDRDTAVLSKPANDKITVLVLCTGNSARSIMAEAILNTVGGVLFRAYSAGSKPTGVVNPLALEQIQRLDKGNTIAANSKSWDTFSRPDAPKLDLVLTVCGNAARESCPIFIGKPERIHWGFPDPAGSSSDIVKERYAFAACFEKMRDQISRLVAETPANASRESIFTSIRSWE